MKKIILLLLLPISIFAQEDLLKEIDTASTTKSVRYNKV